MSKVGIIGAGLVGSTAAHILALRGSCDEIVLLDKDTEKAKAQAADVANAALLNRGARVWAGDYAAMAGAQIVVLTAGIRQRGGMSRSELLVENAPVLRRIVPRVLEVAPEAVVLVATQPVDLMTEIVRRAVGASREPRVLGLGTVLDSMQLRAAVAEHLGIDPSHVHGYAIGEEGESTVLVWSSVNVAGIPIVEFVRQRKLSWDHREQMAIAERVRRGDRRMLEGKGAISYGVGAALARVVEAVLSDSQSILTVSAHSPQYGVALSLPRLIGSGGIVTELHLPLSTEEQLHLDVLVSSHKGILESL